MLTTLIDARLFKLMQKCIRMRNKPDIHSFMVDIENGRAYVEGQEDGVYICVYMPEKTQEFSMSVVDAAIMLEDLGAKFETVEM